MATYESEGETIVQDGLTFYELESRLIAVSPSCESAAAFNDENGWKGGPGRHLPIKANMEGDHLSIDEAKRRFPEADLEAIPELT